LRLIYLILLRFNLPAFPLIVFALQAIVFFIFFALFKSAWLNLPCLSYRQAPDR